MERLWASAAVIGGIDAEAIESQRGASPNRSFEKDHAMLLSSCGRAAWMLLRDEAAIDFSKGSSCNKRLAHDHAVFAKRCGLKSDMRGIDDAEIAANSG